MTSIPRSASSRAMQRLAAREEPARAVAGAAEGVAHRPRRSGEDVGVAPHVPRDEHRLADVPVRSGDARVARAESAGRALAVDEDAAARAVHLVLLVLRDVVADVVEQARAEVALRDPQRVEERAHREPGHHLPVREGEVRGRLHRAEVPAPLVRADRRAGELAIRQRGVVLAVVGEPRRERGERLVADLVPEAARAGVDLEGDRARGADARRDVAVELGGDRVEARAHDLFLEACRHDADAAVDVVADSARGDGAVLRVDRRDAADREAVSPVDVRHREGEAEDAGEVRDVRDLLEGRIVRRGRADAVDAAGHLHPALARDLPEVALDAAEVHQMSKMICATQPSPSLSSRAACHVTAFTSAPSACRSGSCRPKATVATTQRASAAWTSISVATSRAVTSRKSSSRRKATAEPASPGPPATSSRSSRSGTTVRSPPVTSVEKASASLPSASSADAPRTRTPTSAVWPRSSYGCGSARRTMGRKITACTPAMPALRDASCLPGGPRKG